ncbi:MAG TPA: vanadium-dependent haloperoxidase, partial [Sphingomicrobium sp.]
PALTSERYARDLEEVKRIGGKKSDARTPHQTLMARYRITPDMMPALRMVADAKGRRPVENARLFALYNMVNDDALLAVGDAKLHYNYWRPITAIRNAEKDGNPATAAEPGWEPLINTPNHPEYPCGHCIMAASTAELMKLEYGNKPDWGVRVSSRSLPNAAVQVLPDWDKWAEEVSFSRTLGGVHYRFSNEAAEEMGRKISRMAVEKYMRPLK